MVSPLEGSLKKQVAAGFKGYLLNGTIRRSTPTGVDAKGDGTAPTITTAPFEGIRGSFSAFVRAQAGIPETDVSILVLLGSTTMEPRKDDLINIPKGSAKWYNVRRIVDIDPAGATANCQAYEVSAP